MVYQSVIKKMAMAVVRSVAFYASKHQNEADDGIDVQSGGGQDTDLGSQVNPAPHRSPMVVRLVSPGGPLVDRPALGRIYSE